MKKKFSLLFVLILLSGCVESLALLTTTTTSAGAGKVTQSVLSSAFSYGVKQQTGKSPSQHALNYVKKHNPEKKKDTCVSFIKKTNSEVCALIKKRMNLTRAKIVNNKKHDKILKDSSLLLQSKIENKSNIKHLD
jgi:hypothetical protein